MFLFDLAHGASSFQRRHPCACKKTTEPRRAKRRAVGLPIGRREPDAGFACSFDLIIPYISNAVNRKRTHVRSARHFSLKKHKIPYFSTIRIRQIYAYIGARRGEENKNRRGRRAETTARKDGDLPFLSVYGTSYTKKRPQGDGVPPRKGRAQKNARTRRRAHKTPAQGAGVKTPAQTGR